MVFGEQEWCISFAYFTISGSADYLDRKFTPHLLDISKQGLRAKHMKPVFPVGTPLSQYHEALTFCPDCDIPVSLSSLLVAPFISNAIAAVTTGP